MTHGTTLYVWGCYLMGLVLVVSELLLLILRGKEIRGHLGWEARCTPPPGGAEPQAIECGLRDDLKATLSMEPAGGMRR